MAIPRRYPGRMAELKLNTHEARALGVLIEKELTTPDQYPLSLNALVAGCNQKSNRDPVTDFTVAEVVVTMQGLVAKHLAGRSSGGRVEKFQHNTRARFDVSIEESAVLAELLIRGPQQPGELRSRVKRMAPVETQDQLLAILQRLATKGLVRNLGRSAGSRAERWGQLLSESAPTAAPTPQPAAPVASQATPDQTQAMPAATPAPANAAETPSVEARFAALEERVAKLEALLADLGG